MKKGLYLLVSIFCFYTTQGQILFTYGQHSVSKNEFLQSFQKTQIDNSTETKKDLKNYLDLYIDYKLKIQSALDLRIDTLPSFKADVLDYQSQIESQYLFDNESREKRIQEALQRSKIDINVTDYFLSLSPSVDTPKNLSEKLISAQKILLNAGDFEAANFRKDLSALGFEAENRNLGFITVFTLPYQIENKIYALKMGQISEAVKTKSGWHFFKNISERNAVGQIKIAQILIAAPEGDNDIRETNKKKADSIYQLLVKGADFSQMAQDISDDRNTSFSGGDLPLFGVGEYAPVFENAAFALQKDQQISPPIETEFGFHILKRIYKVPVPQNNNDATFNHTISKKTESDPDRMQAAREIFLTRIKKQTGLKKNLFNTQDLWRVTDSSLMQVKDITSGKVNANTNLFTFSDGQSYNAGDWIIFLRNSDKVQPGKLHDSYRKLLPEFENFATLENYRKRLYGFNPKFKKQIDDFKDGNLLFTIMNEKIWSNPDTQNEALLTTYFATNPSKYQWETSADAILVNAKNRSLADQALQMLTEGKSVSEISEVNPENIQVDSTRIELSEIPVAGRTHFTPGLITAPVIDKEDGHVFFAKIIKTYEAGMPRSFAEARGSVISDYQHELEKNWVETLRKKYPVVVNEKVWQSLMK